MVNYETLIGTFLDNGLHMAQVPRVNQQIVRQPIPCQPLQTRDDRRLMVRPVRVDVGVVCLRLGSVRERRGVARKLAAELIHRADTLMYDAKGRRADKVQRCAVRVENGNLVDLTGNDLFERPPAGA